MFIIGYWCDCQEKEPEPEQEQEQEQDILTVGKEIYEHRYCTYEKLALKLARQTNAGQTDRQTGPGRAHMRRGSGFRRSTKFLLFSFRVLFLFFFFFFFLHAFLLAGFLYCVHEWAQHFYLIYVDISLPCLLFYVTFRSPPLSLTLSFPASAAAGNLFDCSSACISLYFFGYVCRSRMERDGKTERGTGWCIYFVSTCSWYLFYESNYLYWNMAYTWDSCVLLRHISIYYFWRACAEIWCCCQFLMVNMMFPLTSLADMHIFISGLRVPKSACVWVCAPRFICANLSLKFDLLFKENLAAISFAGTSHSSFCFWRVWLFFKQPQKI